jgi:hypothetical protein
LDGVNFVLSLSWGTFIALAVVLGVLFHINFRRQGFTLKEKRTYSILVVAIFGLAALGGILTTDCPACAYDEDASRQWWENHAASKGHECCGSYFPRTTTILACLKNPTAYSECPGYVAPDPKEGPTREEREKEEYEDAYDQAKAAAEAWVANERAVCTANKGVLYNVMSYYCNGFQTIREYTSPAIGKYQFPEFDTTSGCCVGTPVPQTMTVEEAMIANTWWLTGTDDEVKQLDSSKVNLNLRHVKDVDGKNQVCFTTNYLCYDALITGEILSSKITCPDEYLAYCFYGCDFDTAECVDDAARHPRVTPEGVDPMPDDPVNLDWLWIILIIGISGVAIYIILGKVMKKRG